jgi:hypothetical protein
MERTKKETKKKVEKETVRYIHRAAELPKVFIDP